MKGENMTKWLFAAAFLLSVLMLSSGCGPWVVRGYEDQVPPERQPDVSVVAMDADLARLVGDRKVAVAFQRAEWTPDGRLKVHLELDNRATRSLAVQIQTVFKDANGNMLEDQTSWEPIVLPRAASTLYTATAMDKRAEKYLIRIRLDIQK